MPKKSLLPKRFETLRDQLYAHLLWQRVQELLNENELENLKKYTSDYGKEACEQKLWGLVRGKISEPLTEFKQKIWNQAGCTARQLIGTQLLAGPAPKKKYRTRDRSDRIRRGIWIKKVAAATQPLLTSMTQAWILTEVICSYFSSQELDEWERRFLVKEADDREFLMEVEKRTGRKVADLVKEGAAVSVHEVAQAAFEGVAEIQELKKAGVDTQLQEALSKDDLGGAVQAYWDTGN